MSQKVLEHHVVPGVQQVIGYDGAEFYRLHIDENGNVRSKNYIWNTSSLAWESATKGTGVGAAVEVENFPAAISGSAVPVTDALDDITAKYKITDIDSAGSTQYFGYVDAGGKWYIMKLSATDARYANGASGYNWAGRGGLGYDYFSALSW